MRIPVSEQLSNAEERYEELVKLITTDVCAWKRRALIKRCNELQKIFPLKTDQGRAIFFAKQTLLNIEEASAKLNVAKRNHNYAVKHHTIRIIFDYEGESESGVPYNVLYENILKRGVRRNQYQGEYGSEIQKTTRQRKITKKQWDEVFKHITLTKKQLASVSTKEGKIIETRLRRLKQKIAVQQFKIQPLMNTWRIIPRNPELTKEQLEQCIWKAGYKLKYNGKKHYSRKELENLVSQKAVKKVKQILDSEKDIINNLHQIDYFVKMVQSGKTKVISMSLGRMLNGKPYFNKEGNSLLFDSLEKTCLKKIDGEWRPTAGTIFDASGELLTDIEKVLSRKNLNKKEGFFDYVTEVNVEEEDEEPEQYQVYDLAVVYTELGSSSKRVIPKNTLDYIQNLKEIVKQQYFENIRKMVGVNGPYFKNLNWKKNDNPPFFNTGKMLDSLKIKIVKEDGTVC